MNGRTLIPACQAAFILFSLLYLAPTLCAQNERWELGVGLSPLSLQEEPLSLLLKYHWSDVWALRVGLGGNYTERSEDHSYLHHPYSDTMYNLSYEYLQVDKKLNARLFLGLQYGKKKADFYWYGATDLYIRYKNEKTELPEGIFYPGRLVLPLGEVLVTFQGADRRTLGFGIRQSAGFQYFINRFVSLSVEGGIFYEWLKVRKDGFGRFVSRSEIPDGSGGGIGSYIYPTVYDENYGLGVSPVTFLIFNYHF